MSTGIQKKGRVTITPKGWKKPMTIDAEKHMQVSEAILSVLGSEAIRLSELSALVARKLPEFEGSIAWYTVTVARDLETRGKIVRHTKPVLYSKPAGTRRAPR